MSARPSTASPSTAPPPTATEILASYGIEEDTSFYGDFTDPRERAVLTVPLRITHAWAINDADVFADVFAENGSLLMKEEQLTSREQIRGHMRAGFAGPLAGARVSGWPLHVTFLDENTALTVTQGGIILEGETETAPERQIRATWVVTEQDGRWVLVSHHGSPVRG